MDSERSHTAHYTNVCRKTYTNETGTDSREVPAPLTNTTLTYINPLPRGAKVPEDQKISKNWRPQKRERGKQIPKKRDWALSRDATFWYFFCDFSGRSPDSTHASYPLTLHSASVPSVLLCSQPVNKNQESSRPYLRFVHTSAPASAVPELRSRQAFGFTLPRSVVFLRSLPRSSPPSSPVASDYDTHSGTYPSRTAPSGSCSQTAPRSGRRPSPLKHPGSHHTPDAP